ncbi:MAG TPA: BREX-6 system BrxE protein [Polyangiaceae bacterium]|nr:BREX-6 system BrxE protein [Polyangiaceae bacterium]
MARKRAVLDALSRDDLLQLLDACDLTVPDRRRRDALVDALARAKDAHLDALLPGLSRDSLKATCRALGLDDGGREKTVLVDRLLGQDRAAPPAPPKPAPVASLPAVAAPAAPRRSPTPPPSPAVGGAPVAVPTDALDRILALQLLVAWAGEGRCEPRRLGWWDTDLIDGAGGGDLVARLVPRTHAWAALGLVREAARRVDAKARGRHGDPDRLRTIFFLGFEVDERLDDRLGELRRSGRAPEEALPLPHQLGAEFAAAALPALLAPGEKAAFEAVPPIGRKLRGAAPAAVDDLVAKLAAALVPVADGYPLPFYRTGG